jgi:hypothetical protein
MNTLDQIKMALKKEYPVIKIGSDEIGYSELSPADYEATIKEWANNLSADEDKVALANQAATDKVAVLAKLGITADEAKLLLS